MLLKVGERMALQGILAASEGNFVTLKLVRELRESLSFDDAEMEKYDVEQRDGQVKWNSAKDEGKEIEIGETMRNVIVVGLKALNDAEKLREAHMGVYEKFVEPGQQPAHQE